MHTGHDPYDQTDPRFQGELGRAVRRMVSGWTQGYLKLDYAETYSAITMISRVMGDMINDRPPTEDLREIAQSAQYHEMLYIHATIALMLATRPEREMPLVQEMTKMEIPGTICSVLFLRHYQSDLGLLSDLMPGVIGAVEPREHLDATCIAAQLMGRVGFVPGDLLALRHQTMHRPWELEAIVAYLTRVGTGPDSSGIRVNLYSDEHPSGARNLDVDQAVRILRAEGAVKRCLCPSEPHHYGPTSKVRSGHTHSGTGGA